VLHHFPEATEQEAIDRRLANVSSPLILIVGDNKFIKTGSFVFNVSGLPFNCVIEIYYKAFRVFGLDYTPECYNLLYLLDKIMNVNEDERVGVTEIFNRICRVDDFISV
jgi:hypothetical protein